MKIVAVVQARIGSSRLRGKVMKEVSGRPLIDILLSRLSRSRYLDRIVLATANSPENNQLARYVEQLGYDVYRGSETDVLDRFYQAAIAYDADTVVRITGDCPITDPDIVDAVIETYIGNAADYASNIDPPSWPDGLDVEVFSFEVLEVAWEVAQDNFSREHVTPFIQAEKRFKKVNLLNDEDLSSERWTVDEFQDFEVIRKIVEYFDPSIVFGWREVIQLKSEHPEYFLANRSISRNRGA